MMPPKPAMPKPRILIVSPALANANNGNWQTAWRWSRMLAPNFQPFIAQHWRNEGGRGEAPGGQPFKVMLALHARRSADSIAAWAKARGAASDAKGLAVVLTGTDLYRDIHTDSVAQRSLSLARRLVVLQECGPAALPADVRDKARVIFQSSTARQTLAKPNTRLRTVMVGHLRDEKSPQTLFEAVRLLKAYPDIMIDHIGDPLDEALGEQARATALACPNYRWLGGLAHEATRGRIQRAHVLVHTSAMEGGAHVVMEAVCSGTPVLASKIDGNVGMLGANYPGYFELGNAQALATLLVRIRKCQLTAGTALEDPFLAQLQSHCSRRAPLFEPMAEQEALISLVNDLLE
jgi:putative glycosyltransferase (TIGR04348 family)